MLLLALTLAVAAPLDVALVIEFDDSIAPRRRLLFDAALRRELGKYPGLLLVDGASPDAPDASCGARDCLTQLRDGLGAAEVVVARLTSVEDETMLSLRRVSLASLEVTADASWRLSGAANEGALLVLGEGVGKLFAGEAPSAPTGVAPELTARWSPPPLPRWTFFGGVGVTGAAVAFAVYSRVETLAAERRFHELLAGEVVAGAELTAAADDANRANRATNLALAATALGGLASALLWHFADFGSDEAALMTRAPLSPPGQ